MGNPKDNLCEVIRQEGTAIVEMGAILNCGAIGYSDAIEVIEATVEQLIAVKEQLKKLSNRTQSPTKRAST